MFKRKRSKSDFAEEIQSHLALEADELEREGADHKEAHRKARVAFGSVPAATESFHGRGRFIWLEKLFRDLRFAARSLRQSPGFAITAILTLALGVGANTAVFSVMNAVLLRSLPVHDPMSVAYVITSGAPQHANNTGDWTTSLSYPVYDALRKQKDVLTDVMAYMPLGIPSTAVRMGTMPEEAHGDMVSGNYFSGLGVAMALGHGFIPQDEDSHAQIAVLSYNYWAAHLASDPNVLGKVLSIKGQPFTIVGVSAAGFEGTEPGSSTDFWIPLQNGTVITPWGNDVGSNGSYDKQGHWWCIKMVARLAPGITREQAAARLQGIFHAAAYEGIGTPQQGEKPPTLSFDEAKNFPGYDDQWGKPLHMLMAMVGLVLLIALTNVVMLLMARNASRQREFSLRMSLGAQRSELLRQLLSESLLLVAGAGVLAWGFAILATRTLGQWAKIDSSLAPDRLVLLFTLGILAVAAILFSLAPFRVAVAGGAEMVLKTASSTAANDAGKTRTGKIIVALQMALCVVLLVSSALVVRTLQNLKHISLGMNTQGLLVFGIEPQGLHGTQEYIHFYEDLQNKLRSLPGVEAVSIMGNRIGSGWSSNNTTSVDGKLPEAHGDESINVRSNDIGADFFKTLQVPILQGREFNDSDTATSQKVVIINETFAKRFLPGVSPLGHTLGSKTLRTIIGVVKDSKYTGISEKPMPMAWYNYRDGDATGMNIEMRVHGNPLGMLPAVRRVVASMDPNLPLIKPMAQQAQFEESISEQILFARLAEFFGGLAVLLVATGLYGTLAYRVSMRTAEIGVRMAIGAQRWHVIWMVMRDSLMLTTAGVFVGVPMAIFAGRTIATSLYGVEPLDVSSYCFAVLGVLVVTLVASIVPAGRAASVDPLRALRTD